MPSEPIDEPKTVMINGRKLVVIGCSDTEESV